MDSQPQTYAATLISGFRRLGGSGDLASYLPRLRHEVARSSVGPYSSKEVIFGFNQGFRPLALPA